MGSVLTGKASPDIKLRQVLAVLIWSISLSLHATNMLHLVNGLVCLGMLFCIVKLPKTVINLDNKRQVCSNLI